MDGDVAQPAQADPLRLHLLPNVIDHDYSKISQAAWRQLHGFGFRSLELGATASPFPTDLTGMLRDLGFSFLGHGAALWHLQQQLRQFIDAAHERQERFLLCYWPWLDGGERITRQQISATCAILQDLGARCRQERLRFAFHNHGLEFAELDGMTICEHMLRETDPDLVSLELDLYHMLKVGCDPAPFIARHAGRIDILHLNAMDGSGDRPVVGDGMPGFQAMISQLPSAHLVIEGHGQQDPLGYAQASLASLRSLLGT
jgi:sugar phosphate isomerase/epimerase